MATLSEVIFWLKELDTYYGALKPGEVLRRKHELLMANAWFDCCVLTDVLAIDSWEKKQFFHEVATMKRAGLPTPWAAVVQVTETAAEKAAKAIPPAKNYHCLGPRAGWRGRLCSTVMPITTFVGIFHPDYLDDPINGVHRTSVLPVGELREFIRSGGASSPTGRVYPRKAPIGWTAPKDEIERVRLNAVRAGGNVPAALRAAVGLAHMTSTVNLVEVQIATDVLERHGLYRPTFIDGGDRSNYVYRSNHTLDQWGLTVDIRSNGNGVAEAVHPPLREHGLPTPFSAVFDVEDIGVAGSLTYQPDYSAMAKDVPAHWSASNSLQFARCVT